MPRIITHAEIARIPDEGVFYVEEGAELTPLARERAAARGIKLTHGKKPEQNPLELEEAARRVLARMNPEALGPDVVNRVIAEVMGAFSEGAPGAETLGLPPSADYCTSYRDNERHRARRRAILTSSGRNQKGLVAALTTIIAEFGGDILDISQTLVGDYFTMLLIVDISEVSATFEAFKEALVSAARQRGIQTILMHEDLVSSLHRV